MFLRYNLSTSSNTASLNGLYGGLSRATRATAVAAILPKNDPSQTVRSAVFFHQRILVTGGVIFTHFYFPLSNLLYVLGERCDSAFVDIVQTSDGKMSRIVELNCKTMKTETLSEVSFIDF